MSFDRDDFIDGVPLPTYERLVECGLRDPHRLEWEREHDEELEAKDRLFEKGGQITHLAYRDRPSTMERRLHFDENRVRSLTHPRTGTVEVQPRACPVDEAA